MYLSFCRLLCLCFALFPFTALCAAFSACSCSLIMLAIQSFAIHYGRCNKLLTAYLRCLFACIVTVGFRASQ